MFKNDRGWTLVLETSNGEVGLYSRWQDGNLMLLFPYNADINNNLECIIEDIFGENASNIYHRTVSGGGFREVFNIIKQKRWIEVLNNESRICIETCFTQREKITEVYQENFLKLVLEIARRLGKILALNVTTGSPFEPDYLREKGYNLEHYYEDDFDNRKGYYVKLPENELMLYTFDYGDIWNICYRQPIHEDKIVFNEMLK